jgi:M6 family metalloprotease-like protein
MRSSRRKWQILLVTLALVGAASLALAQGNSLAAQVRNLNNEILKLHGQFLIASPNEQALIHSRAFAVSQQRAAALAALIEQNASEALRLAFPPDVIAILAQAFPQASGQLEAHGAWTGTLDYVVIDDATMTVSRSVLRLRVGEETLEIHFSGPEPAGLKCGVILRVTGVRAGSRVAAAQGSVVGSSVDATACSSLGNQSAAVIMFTFPGIPQPSILPSEMSSFFFDTNPAVHSLNGFWREVSYNKAWVTGDVFGWYVLDQVYPCGDLNAIRDAAIRAADPQVDFRKYNRIFLVFPNTQPDVCGWGGAGSLSCLSLRSKDGRFTASVSWLHAKWESGGNSYYMSDRESAVGKAAHEGGHNLTLHHADSRDFGPDALGPLGVQGTLSAYGDVFSNMGNDRRGGHYSSKHKLHLGWLSTANPVNIQQVESGGDFWLEPIETNPSGLHALKVRRGTVNDDAFIWVEYRQPIGYDIKLSSLVGPQVFGGALIHYVDSYTGSAYTHLLDFTPGSDTRDFWDFFDPALVNSTWTDPYSNVSITAGTAIPSGLSVTVAYGPLSCVYRLPTVTISPSNPSALPGQTVNYTVSVKNNDSAGCAAGVFTLDSTDPAGWPTGFSSNPLTVSPSQTGTAAMTKTVPGDAAPATYPVNAIATRGSYSGSGAANCTVMAPLTVTVSVPSSSYTLGSTVPITAAVQSGTSPVSGAAVVFTMTEPNGSTSTKKATTDANGTAVWNYMLNPRDPTGTYSVTAKATYGGQTVTSAATTFNVAQ